MNARPAMSNAETEIARVLWGLGSATAREVWEGLPTNRRIDYTTVQTYLSRLEQKGYVKSRLASGKKHYTSKVAPARVVREAVDDFLDRLFGGDPLPLMKHLIDDRKIGPEGLQQLRDLIENSNDEERDAPNSS